MNRSGRFNLARVFLVFGVRRKLAPIHLVLGHGSHINRGERFAGNAGELRWGVITSDPAATLCDGLKLRLRIGAPVGELVGIDGVAQEQCIHNNLLKPLHPARARKTSAQTEVSAKKNPHTVCMTDGLANAARLLAEPARAAMLLKLMGGRAVPAGELALAAHISPQTASEHLAQLAEAGFVTAQRQGRHRYYQLANEEVAYAVESLLVLSSPNHSGSCARTVGPALGTLQHARTCYSHLAGWLGVAITDALQRQGYLTAAAGRAFVVTDQGRAWFEQRGIAVPRAPGVAGLKVARQCLDWTERRPHLAGTLGVAMYKRFSELGWIAPLRKSRAVRVTLEGREAFAKHLHIVVG
jgi:DNA-binding transcriptional ArsR family regulator